MGRQESEFANSDAPKVSAHLPLGQGLQTLSCARRVKRVCGFRRNRRSRSRSKMQPWISRPVTAVTLVTRAVNIGRNEDRDPFVATRYNIG